MAKKKSTKKEIRSKRRERYGMKKIPKNAKMCWLSVENKHGWSLGFALNKYTVWLKNVRFASSKDVESAFDGKRAKIVFIHLKKSKEKVR